MKLKNLSRILVAGGLFLSNKSARLAACHRRDTRTVSLLLLLLTATTAWADGSGTYNNLVWTFVSSTNTLTISGSGELPDANSSSDTGLWDTHSTDIHKIVIGKGVTKIGKYNFDKLHNLTEVTFEAESQLATINQFAFQICENLTTIVIPASVTSIGANAFDGCTSLASFPLPDGVKTIGGYAFQNTGLTSVTIPKNLTYISNSVFKGSKLTTVTIPEGVTTIADYAFAECNSLTAVYCHVPDPQLIYLSTGCFNLNQKIYVINADAWKDKFPESTYKYSFEEFPPIQIWESGDTYVKYYDGGMVIVSKKPGNGNGAMGDNASISLWDEDQRNDFKQLIIKPGVTSIGMSAFSHCTGLTSVSIPASVTSIGKSAFDGCTGLKELTFADNSQLTTIGEYAFASCTGLTSVTIPANVTTIGKNAFSSCTGLTSVAFADNSQLTTIGEYAFTGCTGLTSVTIPANVTTIGKNAFSSCTGLTSVAFADNSQLTTIGIYAFYGCQKLASVIIPANVTTIGKNAFYSCTGLTSVAFAVNSQLTTISEYAFIGCTGLTSVTIPANVTTIGNYAFFDCSNLTSVSIPASVKSIGNYVFYRCTGLKELTFADNSQLTTIGESAFASCTGLTSVTIPASVTSIGVYAFYNCSAMTDVYCYANPTFLTWNENGRDDFIKNTSDPNYPTKCHVYANRLDAFKAKWSTGNPETDVNVIFVGDLQGEPKAASVKIGDTTTEYTDFDDAISAANNGYQARTGTTAEVVPIVTLLDHVEVHGGFQINENKAIVLDLNGWTLLRTDNSTNSSAIEINESARLTITDNSTNGNGIIKCTGEGSAILINPAGVLDATGVSIIAANNAIYNYFGSVSLTDCTITGGNYGINKVGGILTIGSGVTISQCKSAGIMSHFNYVTFNALPIFGSGDDKNGVDICLGKGDKITFGADITAAPTNPITVRVVDSKGNDITDDDMPNIFTIGYGEHVKSSDSVIDPAKVFAYYNDDYDISLVNGEAAVTPGYSYIDTDGTTKTHTATVLIGSETTLGTEGQETWYVCNSNLAYKHSLYLYGDVHLILADGCNMTVTANNNDAIHGLNSIHIYGQSTGENMGKLTATSTDSEGSGIYSAKYIGISHCSVTAVGGKCGLWAYGYLRENSISIAGGQVSARTTGTDDDRYGICSQGCSITLDWASASDYIYANSYYSKYIYIARGKQFVAYDDANATTASAIISGDVSDHATIAGKTLRPLDGYWVTLASADVTLSGKTAADFTIGSKAYYIYKASTTEAPVTVTLSYGGSVPTGYTVSYTVTKAGGGTVDVNVTDGVYSFAMPAEYVTVSATIALVYAITYDLAGGTVATANPTTYTIESEAFTLNNPTRTGYTFAGWTGTGLDAAAMTVTIAKGSTGARSYTATWRKLLTITAASGTKVYDGKALTGSYTSEGLLEGDAIESVTVTGSQTVVGTCDNVASAAVIRNTAGKDVTAKYIITYVKGTLTVTTKTVTAPTITLSETSYVFDGTAKTPTVTVKDGSTTIPDTEYTVSYSNNTAVGTATVTVTDKTGGNFTVSGTATFKIIEPVVPGDANGDKVVNVADIVQLVNDGAPQSEIDAVVKIILKK